jgi:NAD+ kinase
MEPSGASGRLSSVRKVALVVNTDKPKAVAAGRDIINWLEGRTIQPMIAPEGAAKLNRPELAVVPGQEWETAEMMIVLGGDGTLIRAAQTIAPTNVPVLGVNTGHLGFLTEIEHAELFDHLDDFLDGHYIIEERMMLTARVERAGRQLTEMTALNEAVIAKGPRARLIHLGVYVGDTQVAQYPADGVILATPTGSTAYSFSAGGPIVGPTVDVLLVTPICPHTMNSRTMVIPGNEQVSIVVIESPGEVGLSADGSDPYSLARGDVIRFNRAPHYARLIRRHPHRFYEGLREKLANPWR